MKRGSGGGPASLRAGSQGREPSINFQLAPLGAA